MKNDGSTNLFPGIQTFCQEIGEASCYAFCIIKLAEEMSGRTFEPVKTIKEVIKRGLIHYSWDNPKDPDNMYVKAPDKFLELLLYPKARVSVEKVYEQPAPAAGRHVVECWNNAHFRLPEWDSLVYSNSVAHGKITSWRVFTVTEES